MSLVRAIARALGLLACASRGGLERPDHFVGIAQMIGLDEAKKVFAIAI